MAFMALCCISSFVHHGAMASCALTHNYCACSRALEAHCHLGHMHRLEPGLQNAAGIGTLSSSGLSFCQATAS